MGIYWATYLYYGRLLSKDLYERLVANCGEIDKNFIRRVAQDNWILHTPSRLIPIGTIDPILQDNVDQVDHSYVEAILTDNPLWQQQWNALTKSDENQLKTYIKASADSDVSEDDSLPHIYICEIEWSTYGGRGIVEKNIRV